MNLIYYRGLNCYLACIITIVASLDIHYQDAYATLWSETDFEDKSEYRIYASKRVFTNLEALGAKTEVLNCTSKKETEESLSLIPDEALFLVGMDTFYTPWGPVYQHFHGHHYFIAQNNKSDFLFCFDPTYDQKYVKIKSDDILSYASDLRYIHKIEIEPPHIEVSREAQEVLSSHPEMREKLLVEIQKCKNKGRDSITPLIKQIDVMINNRHLFQRYLHQSPPMFKFFDNNFLSQWEAVKNGLYKASIIKNNESVIDEVCKRFLDLVRKEITMAEEMIKMGRAGLSTPR